MKERLEALVPKMDFHRELTERQRLARVNVGPEKRRYGLKFPTLNINFEKVDVRVACRK
jgi:hypothetical protein